ncbi:MAG TPA: 2-C-methyl-D-erythritol 4-phosphate cytidylyltransferase [Actinomycetota bacterium]|nr:2-C-methyl-D-erythritol 4-phosphate cytidylyltransferase [Actinomycetota bacterium]
MSDEPALRVVAVVLAAGRSSRLPGEIPKPFLTVGGRPMLDYSLAAFAEAPSVAAIVVAVPPERREALEPELLVKPKVRAVTAGGAARQDSLSLALAAVPPEAEVVAVHDAARPLVTPAMVGAVVAGVGDGYDGALIAIPLDDAVKQVAGSGEVLGPRSRTGLWRAQTPQAFRRSCLEDGLGRALADGVVCDDCSELATRAGYRVRVVLGDPRNLKVTRPSDLELCERLLGCGSREA